MTPDQRDALYARVLRSRLVPPGGATRRLSFRPRRCLRCGWRCIREGGSRSRPGASVWADPRLTTRRVPGARQPAAASDLHRDPRRPPAQPQGHRHRRAEAPARRVHGGERQRQVVARLRHHLYRGAAPARRDVQHVRPPPAAQLTRPPVDAIRNISPCIVIDQKRLGASSRSTVGRVTEIYTYRRDR